MGKGWGSGEEREYAREPMGEGVGPQAGNGGKVILDMEGDEINGPS
jgi:hypothetical protein